MVPIVGGARPVSSSEMAIGAMVSAGGGSVNEQTMAPGMPLNAIINASQLPAAEHVQFPEDVLAAQLSGAAHVGEVALRANMAGEGEASRKASTTGCQSS